MNFVNKLFGIIIFIGTWDNSYGADVPPTTCVEEQVLDLFTKWRHGDRLPFPLPPLEMIGVQSFEGQYSGYGIKITYVTGEMKLAGVNNFTVEELFASSSDSLEASGTIQFPLLTLTADNYNLKGYAYVFYALKGSGYMYVNFHNVKLIFGIKLGPQDESIQINDMLLNYSVDNIQLNLEDSSWPINKVLNAEALNIVESYHSVLVDAATEGVRRTLNDYLATVTPEQLLHIFVSHCTDNKF